ncbi:MAG: inositol monophosphatase [Planctomycetaceae bacterium]|nr:MAG: inositol monophosphatase [Planctomycetaceae bacterium]
MEAQHLDVAISAAKAGAAELMARRDNRIVSEKAPRDLVTDADVAAQKAIRRVLEEAYPGYAFVGEEQGENDPPAAVRRGDPDAPPCWVVDPLDGTVNFVHRLQNFAVSIGLFAAGRLQLGVVYDPVYEELFAAREGAPATCNGRVMKPSGCERMDEALIACSFPAGIDRHAPAITQFVNVLENCRALRRLGSCALNLCYVADGRLDGYWATCVQSWDAAAGAVICRQAGAVINGYDGGPLDEWSPKFAATSTAGLNRRLTGLLQA